MADRMQPTPRGYISGLFSDAVNLPLQYMSSPERTQQMQGMAQLLYGTGIPKTLERISYGDSLFSGAGGLGGTTRMRPETAEALMNVAPFSPVAGRVGRTVGRLAGEEINAAMTGQPTRSLLGQMTPKPKLLDVYHGTPHTFQPTPRNPLGEFDASKIGTGEGNQAYGIGTYVAEAPVVAKEYRRKLGGVDVKLGNTSLDEIIAKGGEDAQAAQRLKRDFTNPSIAQNPDDVSNPSFWKETENFYQTIDSPENSGVKKLLDKFGSISADTKGSLYKVDLPDEKIATMLDWDKPMTEQEMISLYDRMQQSPLASFAKPFQDNFYARMNAGRPTTDGQDLFIELTKELGGQKQVSDYLRSIGVSGIKYLDEVSRGATGAGKWKLKFANGEEKIYNFKPEDDVLKSIGATAEPIGTRNFVVFPNEEKSMTILERNGMLATPIESPTFTDPFGNTIGSSIR